MGQLDNIIQELTTYTNEVEQIKSTVKTVAENKNIAIEYDVDDALSLLNKIDDGTIATPTGTLNITSNGIVDVTQYANANVNVPSEEPTLGTKTITVNGTYNASDDNLDGYSSVTVNVTSGGSSKFASLVDKSITQVTAEDLSGVTYIGDYAFYECNSLTSITIPSGVTHIGEYVCDSCFFLTSINISSSVTSIGDGAFRQCPSLKTVTFGDNSQLETIGHIAFYNCNVLTSIEIPSSVTYIGEQAFYNCNALTSIEIPSSVANIEHAAFVECSAIKTVTFVENSQLGSIENDVFSNCDALTTINIPSSVTSIGDRAFRNCYNLTSIEIPSGVTSIGRLAFNNCTNLTTVTLEATTPPTIQSNTFDDTVQTFYVPAESVEAYKSATNWSALATQIQPLSTKPTQS